jgi:hypothetical protein
MQQLTEQRNNLPDIQMEMKKFNSEYVDPTEQTNNKILTYLKRKDQLALKFNQGWLHAMVSAEEVYYAGIVKGHPSLRTVNPIQFAYDKGANTTFIHKGNWAREEYWLPIGEVISQFGDVLTDAQVKRISLGQVGQSMMSDGMQTGFVYNYNGGQRNKAFVHGPSSHVYIMTCSWRSYKKVGMLSYPDPRTGKMEEVEVDDTFKMTEELKARGATIEWMWDDEIWEGTMIGDEMFVNVRPKFNQTGNLPYIGYVYNNVNSIATSMVDLVKPHQYTYIIVWWRLEQELAKAKGKKFIMDMAQLPQSQGWTVDQWMYYFENMGVIWINSMEEGRKGDPSSVAQFNQFQSIDMSLSQVVAQYMEILNKLEQLVEDIMGVAPQRMGGVKPSETATGAQTAISRSTNVTKPWFYFHDLVKEAALDELLELAKIAYIDGAEMEMILDDMEIETLKIDGDKLNASQMGVFITNSYEDRLRKEKVEQLLTMAVQQGNASLTDIANVINSESMSYMIAKLDEGEKKAEERASAGQRAQAEAEQAKLARDEKEKQLDRTKDLQETTMKLEADAKISAAELALDSDKEINRSTEAAKELEIREGELEVKQVEAGIKQQDSVTKRKDAETKAKAAKSKSNENRKQS